MLRMCRTRLKSYTSVTGVPHIYIFTHRRWSLFTVSPRLCSHQSWKYTQSIFYSHVCISWKKWNKTRGDQNLSPDLAVSFYTFMAVPVISPVVLIHCMQCCKLLGRAAVYKWKWSFRLTNIIQVGSPVATMQSVSEIRCHGVHREGTDFGSRYHDGTNQWWLSINEHWKI